MGMQRIEPCRVCQSFDAQLVSQIGYWDLQDCNLVRCNRCSHTQLDPMLTPESLEKGCAAYWSKERLDISEKEQKRNLVRNFRRGVAFAFGLKRRGIYPQSMLEFGPGSGYFAEGIRFVFPAIRVTVVDLLESVLEWNRKEHGYDTIQSMADAFSIQSDHRYDLVIARDIIEHVCDVSRMFQNIHELLKPRGLFHFITPNGHEDAWGHRMCFELLHSRSELLINHVNYFDGSGLLKSLEATGFTPLEYYTYDFKRLLSGKGWKKSDRWSQTDSKRSAAQSIHSKRPQENVFRKSDVLNQWYISKRIPLLTVAYSTLKHLFFIRLNPRWNRGHEIYGLFEQRT